MQQHRVVTGSFLPSFLPSSQLLLALKPHSTISKIMGGLVGQTSYSFAAKWVWILSIIISGVLDYIGFGSSFLLGIKLNLDVWVSSRSSHHFWANCPKKKKEGEE